MLIDTRSADSAIDHKNWDFLAFQQTLRQLHSPPTKLRFLASLSLPDWVTPKIFFFQFAYWTPIAANPLVGNRRRLFTRIRRKSIGLTVDQISITADEIAHRFKNRFAAACDPAKLHLVHDQAWPELHCKLIRPVGR